MKKQLLLSLILFLFIAVNADAVCNVQAAVFTNVRCFGQCNGVAGIVMTTGSGPFTYVWSPSSQIGATVSNLCAGVYAVTMTDATGCTATSMVTITQPQVLSPQPCTSTNVSCYGGNNGCICILPTGGT